MLKNVLATMNASKSAIDFESVFNYPAGMTAADAEAAHAEYRDELESIVKGQAAVARLESLLETGKGASVDMMIQTANHVLADLDLGAPLEYPSMESIDENPEIAMEGIGEIITKVKNWVSEKIASFKERLKKAGDAIKYKLGNQYKRAEILEGKIKADGMKEGTIKLGPEQILCTQIDQKVVDYPKLFVSTVNSLATEHDGKILEAILKVLGEKKLDSAVAAFQALSKGVKVMIKESGQTEANAKDLKLSGLNRTSRVYATGLRLKSFQQYTVTDELKLDTGDSVETFRYQGWQQDNANAITSMSSEYPALNEKQALAILETSKAASFDVLKNFEKLVNLYGRAEEMFTIMGNALEGTSMSKGAFQQLVSEIHSLIVGYLFYMESAAHYMERLIDGTLGIVKASTK